MQVLLFGGYTRDLTGLTSQVRQAEQADEGLGGLRQSSPNSAFHCRLSSLVSCTSS